MMGCCACIRHTIQIGPATTTSIEYGEMLATLRERYNKSERQEKQDVTKCYYSQGKSVLTFGIPVQISFGA